MNINLDQNINISAQWMAEVCTPTPTGTISEYPFGTGFRNNAILNYFLSGIILHLSDARDPKMFYPARFTDGSIQLGTGLKPITYTDRSLDKFYQESSYVRPLGNRVDIQYITGSGMAIFEKIYDFPTAPGVVKYTEAGFKQVDAAADWSRFGISPIYSRFLFTEETIVTGYVSGILDQNGFKTLEHPLNQVSGVFVQETGTSGVTKISQYEINKKSIQRQYITGFISGYLSFTNQFSVFNGENRGSGYFLSGDQFLFPPKPALFPENVTGFISGNMTELGGFIPYNNELSASGYYLDNNWYNFLEPFNEFSGLSGFEYGYAYSGFSFLNGSGFISDIENEIYGAGKLTGFIGTRNISKIAGQFSGFSGLSGFDNMAGHEFFMFFMPGSGFGSGFVQDPGQPVFGQLKFGTGKMTGIIGYRNLFFENIYSGLSGIPSHEYGWYFINSGIFGANNNIINGQYNVTNNYLMTGFSGIGYQQTNLVIGFISGYQNENGQFSPFFGSRNASGYFYPPNNQKFYFPTGAAFGGFSNDINFIGKPISYTGFSFPAGSGFSGLYDLASGTGIVTGYIGHVIETYTATTGFGALTGIIGYKKYISPITLNLGQYIKIKYRIAFRVPQVAQETLVTGNNLVYGDFNASGKLKLVGTMQQIFGTVSEDILGTNNGTAVFVSNNSNGIWWPVTDPVGGTNYPFPRIGLSASMLQPFEALNYNPTFPAIDSRPRFSVVRDTMESYDEPLSWWFMFDPLNKYPLKNYNTLYSSYSGGYELQNLFVFTAEFPNSDQDIGGFYLSTVRYQKTTTGPWQYYKPDSGNSCGWLYKFNTPQRKWEDQILYLTTNFRVQKDQLFEDPYYGRYPQ